MAMIGGLADPDYETVLPEKTPKEIALQLQREAELKEEYKKQQKYYSDNPLKVNLGKKDVLFIVYFGRYFLINKHTCPVKNTLLLKHETKYYACLIFDDKGAIIKSKPSLNTFIQDIVDKNGSEFLMDYVVDLTDLSIPEAHSAMKKHRASILHFKNHFTKFEEFKSSLNN